MTGELHVQNRLEFPKDGSQQHGDDPSCGKTNYKSERDCEYRSHWSIRDLTSCCPTKSTTTFSENSYCAAGDCLYIAIARFFCALVDSVNQLRLWRMPPE